MNKLEFVKSRQMSLTVFRQADVLRSRLPNDSGFFVEYPYSGEEYDNDVFEIVRLGWDHDHCFICFKAIKLGDEWYEAKPPDEIGICSSCYDTIQSRPV